MSVLVALIIGWAGYMAVERYCEMKERLAELENDRSKPETHEDKP